MSKRSMCVSTEEAFSKLHEKTRIIVEAHFEHPNLTQTDLAKKIGVPKQRVSAVLNHPRVQALFPVLARKKLKSMVPMAIKRLGQLANQDRNLEVSRKVTERVLDSEKVLEVQEIKIKNTFEVMPTDELTRIVKQNGDIANNAVDTELVDEQPNP